MAKEGVKAREVKRAKLVAKYAEKRAALKSRWRLRSFRQIAKSFITGKIAQPLQINRPSAWLYAPVRHFTCNIP